MCSPESFRELTLDLGRAALSGQNGVGFWGQITKQRLSDGCSLHTLALVVQGLCGSWQMHHLTRDCRSV